VKRETAYWERGNVRRFKTEKGIVLDGPFCGGVVKSNNKKRNLTRRISKNKKPTQT